MNNTPYLLAAVLLLPLALSAATINTSVTCQLPGQPTFKAINNCQATNVSAMSFVSLTLSSDPTLFSAFTANQSAYASPLFEPSQTLSTVASSEADLSAELITLGPTRTGFIQIQPSGSRTYTTGDAFGNSKLVLRQGSNGIYFALTPDSSLSRNLFPVTLGDAISINYLGNIGAGGSFQKGANSITIQTSDQFRFFEADGVTSVAVTEVVPEPTCLGLWGLGIAACFGWKRRRALKVQM